VVLKTSNFRNNARANNIEKFAGQLVTVRFLVQICKELRANNIEKFAGLLITVRFLVQICIELAFKSTIKKTWTEGE
jgi:hypothetical protein